MKREEPQPTRSVDSENLQETFQFAQFRTQQQNFPQACPSLTSTCRTVKIWAWNHSWCFLSSLWSKLQCKCRVKFVTQLNSRCENCSRSWHMATNICLHKNIYIFHVLHPIHFAVIFRVHVADRVVSILTRGKYQYLTELGSAEMVFLKGHCQAI